MQCSKCGRRRAKNKPCKHCNRNNKLNYKRTLKGIIRVRYSDMVRRIDKKGWIPFDKTSEEFYQAFKDDFRLHMIYDIWSQDDKFSKWDAPSIDRIDASKPYSMDNIQWLRWEDNWLKGVNVDHTKNAVKYILQKEREYGSTSINQDDDLSF